MEPYIDQRARVAADAPTRAGLARASAVDPPLVLQHLAVQCLGSSAVACTAEASRQAAAGCDDQRMACAEQALPSVQRNWSAFG